MVKQGDRVRVDGKESVVKSSWGQGKHTAYSLEDGRTVMDLTESDVVTPPPVRKHERLPRAGEDLEE